MVVYGPPWFKELVWYVATRTYGVMAVIIWLCFFGFFGVSTSLTRELVDNDTNEVRQERYVICYPPLWNW